MWSLRRYAFPFKRQVYCLEVSGLLCEKKQHTVSRFSGDNPGRCYPSQLRAIRNFSEEENYHASPIFGKNFLCNRGLFSWVSKKFFNENDVKEVKEPFLQHEDHSANVSEAIDVDGGEGEEFDSKPRFPDDYISDSERGINYQGPLERKSSLAEDPHSAHVSEAVDVDGEAGEEFDSEPRFPDDYISDSEHGLNYPQPLKRKSSLELLRTIMDHPPGRCISSILKNFLVSGEDLSQVEAYRIIFILWKHHMYHRALQIFEWLETTKDFEHSEHDYALRLDLIAKVEGVDVAEKYVENVPDSFRGELLYRKLLSNFVHTANVKKSEEVFEKIRNSGLPITIYACNQMILLYKIRDKRKLPGFLMFMEMKKLTPSRLTYRIVIDAKGESGDVGGMEKAFEIMKSEGLQPDIHVLTVLAGHYISEGLKDKAIAILKEIEGGNLQGCIGPRSALLPIYASLDMADDVCRIWNHCKSDPTMKECAAAIAAWGKLHKVEEAEAVFEMASQKFKSLSSKLFSALLRVYVLNNQISKGKEFVKKMRQFTFWTGPLVWDGLVRLYVADGDVEKAASILSKAAQKLSSRSVRPMYNTYLFVMEQYAKRGDIHNTEKWLFRMRQCGYSGYLRPFQILIQAYLKAQTPAYGLRERMKAEDILPNKDVSSQLLKIEALKRDVLLFGSK